jgi:hypothetical protein
MKKTSVWQYKSALEFCKTVLVDELLREREADVCQVQCGPELADVGKFRRAGCASYMGVDRTPAAQLEKVHGSKGSAFPEGSASFSEGATLHDEPFARTVPSASLDAVVAFDGALEDSFGQEVTAREAIANVARVLRSGGTFVGVMADASRLWTLTQKTLEKSKGQSVSVIESSLFSLSFEQGIGPTTFLRDFGIRYALSLDDASKVVGTLVNPSILIDLCIEHGLQLVDMPNLLSFYYDSKAGHAGTLARYGIKKMEQAELVELHCCFVFRKL